MRKKTQNIFKHHQPFFILAYKMSKDEKLIILHGYRIQRNEYLLSSIARVGAGQTT